MFSEESFSIIRACVLGLTGLLCLTYAGLALLLGRPDPMPWWIPGAAGLASVVVVWGVALVAGHREAARASDEGYGADNGRAMQLAFWVALLLYPAFALPLHERWLAWPTAFAAMGTLTGATYLLLFAWFGLRLRA